MSRRDRRTRVGLFSAVALVLVGISSLEEGAVRAQAVTYDIVYVRWPRRGDAVVGLPQSEAPWHAEAGADLVLHRPNGSERVLVDCDNCCVQDPMISFDGEWVYYTKIDDATNPYSPSLLYKMRIAGAGADYREIQLTFNEGTTNYRYAGNTEAQSELSSWVAIRDMGPQPLPGGKIAFTSNRMGTIAFRGTPNIFWRHVMQMFVMDDHDGRLNTSDLSNLRQVGFGNLGLVLHPVILKDGRLLFTNWDAAGGKYAYAMSTLYAMHPDGSNLQAITEPHDRFKNADHFHTQLGDGMVVTTQYYPSYNFGFGSLHRFPIDVDGPDYQREPVKQPELPINYSHSWRQFDRIGWQSVTPHTRPEDCPAPNLSGKYCMPSAAPGNDMLVVYSPGGVNYNHSCSGGANHVLQSGIFLIPDASERIVLDPTDRSQLVLLIDSPNYNEIWPRAVVPYRETHGMDEPVNLPWTDSVITADDRLEPAEPHAVVGTSSLYNRESAPTLGDPFRNYGGRHFSAGTWTVQGADAGVISNSDIHGVRIIGVVPTPFRKPARPGVLSHIRPDAREDPLVRGYGSTHAERWKIIAEIPVRKREANGQVVLDPKGDADTSFAAKIPADVPFFYQGIDKDGMTLFSELTWRAAKAGEVRTDCGGCHAHSIAPVDFAGTAAGRRHPISTPGVSPDEPFIAGGIWDVTRKTPLMTSDAAGNPTIRVVEKGMVGIEFFRDVDPILQRRCVSCHRTSGNTTGTRLAFDGGLTAPNDTWSRLARDASANFSESPPGGYYVYPQLSKYVRANQARQSLIVWKLFGRRLDGRTNADRDNDHDFTPHSVPHGATLEECRTIARWIDLGCPINYPDAQHEGWRYTDDNLLPTVDVGTPRRGRNASFDGIVRVGVSDLESGVDWDSVRVSIDTDLSDGVQLTEAPVSSIQRPSHSAVAWIRLSDTLPSDREILMVVMARDRAGNMDRDAIRFWISSDPSVQPDGIPSRPVDETVGNPPGDSSDDTTTVASNDPPPPPEPEPEPEPRSEPEPAPPPAAPPTESEPTSAPPTTVSEPESEPPASSPSPSEPAPEDTDPGTSESSGDGGGAERSTSVFGCGRSPNAGPGSLWFLLVPIAVCVVRRRRAQTSTT